MTYAMYCLLNVHVSASEAEVLAELRKRTKAEPSPELCAAMLREHEAARELYTKVMAGKL